MIDDPGAAPPRDAGLVRPEGTLRWRLWLRPLLIGLIVAAANVAAFWLLPPTLLERMGSFGYLGAFVSAAFANATVLVPVPYYPLLIRLAQAFNPWGVVFAAAAGSVVGELVAYYVGRSGKQVVTQTRFFGWVQGQLRHPWAGAAAALRALGAAHAALRRGGAARGRPRHPPEHLHGEHLPGPDRPHGARGLSGPSAGLRSA